MAISCHIEPGSETVLAGADFRKHPVRRLARHAEMSGNRGMVGAQEGIGGDLLAQTGGNRWQGRCALRENLRRTRLERRIVRFDGVAKRALDSVYSWPQ